MNKNCIRKCTLLADEAYTNKLKSITNSYLIENKETDAQIHIGIENNNIYVVCRGTSSFTDIITDLKVSRKKCIFLKNTYIHRGFLEQYTSVRDNLVKKINEINNVNIKRIVFCGHSLGGALATIGALDFKLQNTNSRIHCITFASPRVGNTEFSKLFNKEIKNSCRIVYHRDPVSFLPTCLRFAHVKGCIHFKKNGDVNISDKYFYPFGCFITQHFMENYKERVNKWLDNESIILEM